MICQPGDLLFFPNLDVGNRHLSGALTLGYRLNRCKDEPWTKRFNTFKAGGGPAMVRDAANALATALQAVHLAPDCPPNRITAVCAIPSREQTIPKYHQVYRLALTVSSQLGWEFRPGVLCKRPHSKLHQQAGAAARDAEVGGAYRCDPSIQEHRPQLVVVFDDIVTRGSTLEDCARAIHVHVRVPVFGLALGKSTTSTVDNRHLLPYEHLWPPVPPLQPVCPVTPLPRLFGG